MPRRYVVRKIVAKKRKWMRSQTFFTRNFGAVAAQTWVSYNNQIAVNALRTGNTGSALNVSATRIKIKNIRVEFNCFDTNIGESFLASIVYVPNGRDPGLEENQSLNQLGARDYSFACPDHVLAQKHVAVNDNDDSHVVLFTRLAKWLGPGDSIQLLMTHINGSAGTASNAGLITFACSYVVCDN